jgi:hypothetical protein
MVPCYRPVAVLTTGLFLVVLSGCGGNANRPVPDAKQQATVTGSLLNAGKPLPLDYQVVFNSKDKGAIGSGRLDSAGKFKISAGDPAIGLPAGRYTVKIAPPPPPAPAVGGLESDSYQQMMKTKGSTKAPPREIPKDIPAKLLNWETSGLEFDVIPGPNTFDIDIAKLNSAGAAGGS